MRNSLIILGICLCFSVVFNAQQTSVEPSLPGEKEEIVKSLESQKELRFIEDSDDINPFSEPVSNQRSEANEDLPLQNLESFSFELDKSSPHEKNSCDILFDGFDKRLNTYRKELAADDFFSFTHPKLKPHFKSRDFLTCRASVAQIGKEHKLQFSITVTSKNARKNYGQIRKDGFTKIQFIDGTKIYLKSLYTVSGELEKYTGNTRFKVLYDLPKDKLKKISKIEIDKIGIVWTSGFEEYEIYEIDFLMNQVQCLLSK